MSTHTITGAVFDSSTFANITVTEEISTHATFISDGTDTAPKVAFYIFIGIMGMIDNGFVVAIMLSSKTMRATLTNILIVNQSVIDFVTSFFVMVNSPTVDFTTSMTGLAGEIYCRFWLTNHFVWSLFYSSSFSLILITIERYMEVVHPIRHKTWFTHKRAYQLIAVTWILGQVYNMVTTIPTSKLQDGVCINVNIWPSPAAKVVAGVSVFVLTYLLAVLIMIYCYTKMIISIHYRVTSNATLPKIRSVAEKQRAEKMAKVRRNIIKTLILVGLCYIICWSLNQFQFLLFNLGHGLDFTSIFYHIGVYLVFMNSFINPLVYALQYRQFQIATKKLLCKSVGRRIEDTSTSTMVIKVMPIEK